MNLPSPEKIAALEQRLLSLGIEPAALLEKFVRGSGAGGQKINKTSNCVFLKHLPTGIAIKCQMDRSREMNRFLARRELCDQFDAIANGKASAKTQAIEKCAGKNAAGHVDQNNSLSQTNAFCRRKIPPQITGVLD